MYKLEIDDKTYQLDQEWNVNTWLQLHKFDFEQEWLWSKIISIACGAPQDLVALMEEDQQREAVLIISANMTPNWASLETKIGKWEFKDLRHLTIGEFIDMEVALARGLEKNLDWLVSTLYGCDRKQVLTWNYEWAFAALQTWFVHRKGLLEEYASLFEFEDQDERDENLSKVDPAHNWYDMLMVLADEEFLNINQVVDRPVYEALNFLSWKKDQAKKAELEQKKLQMSRR